MPFFQNNDYDYSLDTQNLLIPDEFLWSEQLQAIEPLFPSAATDDSPGSHPMLPQSDESTVLSRLASPEVGESPEVGSDIFNVVGNYIISEDRWMSIEDELAQHREPPLPSRTRLSQFVRRYFHGFHCHQPFLHPPTWSPNTSNTALLLAVCACGAQYSLETEAASQLLKASIACLPYQKQDIQTLKALMVIAAASAWSGSPDDLKIALGYYGQMAMLIRSEWDRNSQIHLDSPLDWETWIGLESLRR